MNKTIDCYNNFSQIYDEQVVDFWNNFPISTINDFTKRLSGKKVLNLGSGSGRDSVLLRNHRLEVICFDGSEEMIKRTRELGFDSIQGDFAELSFENNSFDGVWAYTSLLHVPEEDLIKVLDKILLILKDKGVLLLGMIEGEFEGYIEEDGISGNNSRFFKYYTSDKLKVLAESVGFRLVYEERYIPRKKVFLSQVFMKN